MTRNTPMSDKPTAVAPEGFLAFSARCGIDPLRVQGPGGNTSWKQAETLWIKASGTELAAAETANIFVPVDRSAALAEAHGAGDGTCQAAVLGDWPLRPSIETTFHALIDWPVVAHTHSVAVIIHAIAPEGRAVAKTKLDGLPVAFVPYCKPGRPLTAAIADHADADTRVFILENHGLIVAGEDVSAVAQLMDVVEDRLALPLLVDGTPPSATAPDGFTWCGPAALAKDPRLARLATGGSYYPDHVVFLGPGLPTSPTTGAPAVVMMGEGLALRDDATTAQHAMAICIGDVLCRLPRDWTPQPIGPEAEAELLNWDAEKYRQALAARGQ